MKHSRLFAECTKHQERSITISYHDGFDRIQCLDCGSIELRPVGAVLFSNANALDEIKHVVTGS